MVILNPPLTWKGDFRNLSCEMGYKWGEIIYFQSLQNPMDAILRGCMNIPIEQLMIKFEKPGLDDRMQGVWSRSISQKVANVPNVRTKFKN